MPKGRAIVAVFAVLSLVGLYRFVSARQAPPEHALRPAVTESLREIRDVVKPGETMSDIFNRHGLGIQELFSLREASADIHRLKDIVAGQPYRIRLDSDNNVVSLSYQIDDAAMLRITRGSAGFRAERIEIPYETKIGELGGTIENNLYEALGNTADSAQLAYSLADIFSWDIDFTTDLRKGDTFKVVVEEEWLGGKFKRYGNILAAEFTSGGTTYRAFRFRDPGGRAGYFDEQGRSVARAFLKAPLSYRRISSGFSYSRLHPILKIRRPHLGIDYVAPRGTPVSALGDGVVRFAAYKGPNGNLVIIRHPNGYTTYYGHLKRIRKGVRRGVRVAQGDVIGYVGATGMATGPHLDFRIRKGRRFINPLRVDVPRGKTIPKSLRADYERLRDERDRQLASIVPSPPAPGAPPAAHTVASSR